jgi:hypothetical protein
MVMVVVTVVVMSVGSERRIGQHHQDQEERCCKNLFHGTNVARLAKVWKTVLCAASKEETGAGGARAVLERRRLELFGEE